MRPIQSIIIIFLSSLVLWNCKAITEVNLIYNTKVTVTPVRLKDKTILLTPIVHFGQQEFFNNLRDSIIAWKNSGYTIFYEEMNIGPHEHSIPLEEYEVIFRKFRKMTGGSATREGYSELKETFEGGITQPTYAELGIDSLDFNADVTIREFVIEYERLYGQVQLDSCDMQTSLDSLFTCEPLSNVMKPVVDDFRNEMLVKQLVEAKQDKIVVLYGAHHIKPLKKALKAHQ